MSVGPDVGSEDRGLKLYVTKEQNVSQVPEILQEQSNRTTMNVAARNQRFSLLIQGSRWPHRALQEPDSGGVSNTRSENRCSKCN